LEIGKKNFNFINGLRKVLAKTGKCIFDQFLKFKNHCSLLAIASTSARRKGWTIFSFYTPRYESEVWTLDSAFISKHREITDAR
jgi:hypothetical protein